MDELLQMENDNCVSPEDTVFIDKWRKSSEHEKSEIISKIAQIMPDRQRSYVNLVYILYRENKLAIAELRSGSKDLKLLSKIEKNNADILEATRSFFG